MTLESTYPTRLVATTAPEWSATALVNGEMKTLSSTNYDKKWKVFFFYPLNFTFVCPTEITAFSDAVDRFKSLNTEIAAFSVDSQFSHLAWTQKPRNEGGLGEVNFPLVADLNKEIARKFGVLLEDAGIALRGLFVIDDQNTIQHSTINNLSVGRNVDETLRLVEAYQFTAKHGEVCPANWKKGDDSMRPDPKGSQDWFKKHK